MVVQSTLLSTLRNCFCCQSFSMRRFLQTVCDPLLLSPAPFAHSGLSSAGRVGALCGNQSVSKGALYHSSSLQATRRPAATRDTLQSRTQLDVTTPLRCISRRSLQGYSQVAQKSSRSLFTQTSPSMTPPCCAAQQHTAGFPSVAPSSTLDLVSGLVAERAALARGSRATHSASCQSPLLSKHLHFFRSPFPTSDWSTGLKTSQQEHAVISKCCPSDALIEQSRERANSPFRPATATPALSPHTSPFRRQLLGQRGRQLSGPSAKMAATTTENPAMLRDESVGSSGGVLEANVLKALEEKLGSPIDYGPSVPPSKPLVIIISGPSGVGKDAVIKRLQERRRELHMVVTATSRPARKGEVHGEDYFFITKDEFQDMINRDELLEHALVYGDFKGIPKQQVRETMDRGTDVVLRIDVQGAATIRAMLGAGGVFIFLAAESEAALVRRLVERKTESLEKALLRLETARAESKRMADFDYVVVNADGQLDRTVDTIAAIIDAEKAKVHPREPKL